MQTAHPLRQSLIERARKVQLVPLPDGDPVYVRPLTQADVVAMPKGDDGSTSDFTAFIVTRSACDEHGTRIFGDDDVAEVATLGIAFLKPIADAAMTINKFGEAKNA